MDLKEDLLRGIYSYGFEAPSSIQSRAITQIISGKDVIAQAQSGTGKTATFTIGLLQAIDLRKTQTFLNTNNKNFVVEVIGNELYIKTTENILILNVANETHALRLKEVIENIKK